MIQATEHNPLLWAAVGGTLGAAVALAVGILAVLAAPNNGFADLAAAAVTRTLLIPSGGVIGAIVGYQRSKKKKKARHT